MKILKSIQNQPEHIRKIILWATVVLLALILGVWWIKEFGERLKGLSGGGLGEQLGPPSFEEELKKLPQGEDFQGLKELFERLTEEQ